MTKTMTRCGLCWFTVVLLAGGFCSSARADPIDYAKLPIGTMTPPPAADEAPKKVGAGEKVPGIHPARPPKAQTQFSPPGMHYVTLFSTVEAARDHTAGRWQDPTALLQAAAGPGATKPAPTPPPAVCFATVEPYLHQQQQEHWPAYLQRQPTVHSRRGLHLPPSMQAGSVSAVHTEWLAAEPQAHATLKIADAWLDVETLGVRLIRRSTMTLKRIATGPADLRIYAARDGDGRSVHFVLYLPPPKAPAGRQLPPVFLRQYMRVYADRSYGHSDCGHARVTLRSDPGVGQSGAAELEVTLPSADEDRRAPVTGTMAPVPVALTQKLKRTRPLTVHLSVSQSTADGAPIPSVAFKWRGREQHSPAWY